LKQVLSMNPDSQQEQEFDTLNHLFEPTYAEITVPQHHPPICHLFLTAYEHLDAI
jgi:hypothetical protein